MKRNTRKKIHNFLSFVNSEALESWYHITFRDGSSIWEHLFHWAFASTENCAFFIFPNFTDEKKFYFIVFSALFTI